MVSTLPEQLWCALPAQNRSSVAVQHSFSPGRRHRHRLRPHRSEHLDRGPDRHLQQHPRHRHRRTRRPEKLRHRPNRAVRMRRRRSPDHGCPALSRRPSTSSRPCSRAAHRRGRTLIMAGHRTTGKRTPVARRCFAADLPAPATTALRKMAERSSSLIDPQSAARTRGRLQTPTELSDAALERGVGPVCRLRRCRQGHEGSIGEHKGDLRVGGLQNGDTRDLPPRAEAWPRSSPSAPGASRQHHLFKNGGSQDQPRPSNDLRSTRPPGPGHCTA